MILSNRTTVLKYLSSAIIITISIIFLFNYHIWNLWKWSAISILKIPSFPIDNSIPSTSQIQTTISKTGLIAPLPSSASSSPSSSEISITLSSQPAPPQQLQPKPQPKPKPEPEPKPINTTTSITLEKIIPPKIWYKLGPKGLSPESETWIQSCIDANPNHTITFLDDSTAETYINTTFSTIRPDIVTLYNNLQIPILKADLLRYLLLYTYGGIWSDLDVSCSPTIPIEDWIPEEYKRKVGLVAGLEFDAGWGDEEDFLHQFVSWVILAERGSVHLWRVVEDILDRVKTVCLREGVDVGELTLEMVGDVVDFTGPRAFTGGVVRSLNSRLLSHENNDDPGKGEKGNLDQGGGIIDYRNFSSLLEPKLIQDVLVLPGWAFADSANVYGDEVEVGEVLVTHHYAGSWKNDHGGEMA